MRDVSHKFLLASAISLVAFAGTPVFATGPHANAHAEAAAKPDTTNDKPDTSGKPADVGSKGSTHLAEAQLKACQNRETAINNIMARIVDRGTKQIGVFDTIATRTETFYVAKGKTLANYSTLVATVNAAHSKAEADLSAMKTTDSIDCASADPKGSVLSFKTNLKLEISDLNMYKTAVKNLIVAVKSVQEKISSTATESSSSTTSANQGGVQ
jgi:hypothetical protein